MIEAAGSYNQFNQFLEENGATDSEYVYCWHTDQILGIEASEVIVYGTFWERNDAEKLYEFAQSRVR